MTPLQNDAAGRADHDQRVTVRGLLVGAAMCGIIAVGIPYGSMVVQGTRLGLSSCTPAAFFLLFILLITVQIALGAVRRSWALSRAELVTVFAMMAVATAIPTRGVTGMLLPMITGSFYYSTPENNWADLIHPLLSDWMVVDNVTAVKQFYEGGGESAAIPWNIWVPPLFRWFSFYAGFWLTLVCIMAVLRRPWVEHERLVFPLAQLPLAMIHDGDAGSEPIVKPFFKNPIMWCGLAIPFFLNSINALSLYYQFITPINPVATVDLFRHSVILSLRVNYLMFGFAYFISANISFSLWFFYLIHVVQVGVFSVVGIHSPEELGPWTGSGPVGAIMGHQMMGSLMVLVLFGLWTARSHLRQVVLKAIGRAPHVDDSDEILSYRVATIGLVAGVGFMGFWLWQSGIPAHIVPLFILSALIILIGLARIVAEAGLPTITPEMIPAGFVVSGVGIPALGMQGMVATGYTLAWAGDLLVFMTAPLSSVLRLSSETGRGRRRLTAGIGIAMAISLVLSAWFLLHLAYRDGAINLHPQYFSGFAQYPSQFAAQKLANPSGPSLAGWLWTAAGGLVMAMLMVARHHFIWWPLHPLGFVVSPGWAMDNIWFSVFLAWGIKVLVLKYGGPGVYAKTRPFFLGVVLGQFVVGGMWLVIDSFTGTVGNSVPVY